jgi:protein-disulfide isomerase
MKGFYVLLLVVAIGGVAWLVYSAQHKPEEHPGTAAPIPVVAGGAFRGYTLGSDSAPVHVTEYSDFECPFCASFATVQMPEVRTQLITTGKVQWRFRDFPLPRHKYSRFAALAAQCAGEQGKFWEMHDQLFYNHQWAQQGKNPSALFRGFAKTVGVDTDRYDACMDGQRYAGRLDESWREGEAIGVDATPKIYVEGRFYQGTPTSDGLKALVDSLIAHRKR